MSDHASRLIKAADNLRFAAFYDYGFVNKDAARFSLSEANGSLSREEVTVAAASPAMVPGTLLGIIRRAQEAPSHAAARFIAHPAPEEPVPRNTRNHRAGRNAFPRQGRDGPRRARRTDERVRRRHPLPAG